MQQVEATARYQGNVLTKSRFSLPLRRFDRWTAPQSLSKTRPARLR
ncbi:MAG: hypothetical protein ABIO62_09665 [Paracoccaceae bacterium]